MPVPVLVPLVAWVAALAAGAHAFGHALLPAFTLASNYTNLNHGCVPGRTRAEACMPA